ncbi:MAG: LysM peptidoglycan-binding domain-containing protein [Planctomycetota bacterium]|nr:LysM peptidoglycan-binding domain-containing protein [Planctomycetota bacterium]
MQRIERYGVVAMVFLVVTIAAITFWEGGESALAEEPRAVAKARVIPAAPVRKAVASNLERPRRARAQAPLAGVERPAARNDAPDELKRIPVAGGRGQARVEPLGAGSAAGARSLRKRNQRPGATRSVALATKPTGKPTGKPVGAPRVSAPAPVAEGAAYVVQAGDTLSEIAQAALGSARRWPEIVELNAGVTPDSLRVGIRLRLPVGRTPQPTIASVSQPAPAARTRVEPLLGVPASDRTHVVAPGEVLSVIAQRELGSARRWREIVDLNPGLNPDRLAVGTVLALPVGAAASGNTAFVASASVARTTPGSARVR